MKHLITCFLLLLTFSGISTSTDLSTNSFKNCQLPFLQNMGQHHPAVSYYANMFSGTVFLTKQGEIVYALHDLNVQQSKTQPGKQKEIKSLSIREEFVNANINRFKGNHFIESKINYINDSDPSKWKNDIPAYESVSLGEIFQGIEVVLKAHANNVEKLFFVKPGFSPDNIKLRVKGGNKIKLSATGELEILTDLGIITFSKPIAFQGENKIKVDYYVEGNDYGFKVGDYNPDKMLVIDPLLASTFIGGTTYDDNYEPSIAIDKNGNVFISGYTYSSNFPVTTGVYDQTFSGGSTDRFIAKFNSDLSTLIASTFIGGSGIELGMGLGLDDSGNVFIAGYTTSSNFPVTTGAFDETSNGGQDVYIAKLDNNLSSLLASTYLGGSGNEGQTWPRIDLTIDKSGQIYIAGLTRSTNFPVSANAFDNTYNGGPAGGDPFIAKFDNDLTTLLASTYLGGSGNEWRVSVLTDNKNNVFICGETESSNYPTTGGVYDRTFDGLSDVFISKLDTNLSTLLASTLIGKNNVEEALGMRLNNNDEVFIVGYTKSSNFPTTQGVYAKSYNGGERDAYIAKFDNDLKTLLASTLLGGGGKEDCRDIIIGKDNNLYITGNTTSSNFPVSTNAFDGSFNGSSSQGDVFIAKIDENLTTLISSTFLGSSSVDAAYCIASDNSGNIYIGGITTSTGFPTTEGAYDRSYNGNGDCFLSKLDSDLSNNVTSVDEKHSHLKQFELKQNYPNPFNPSTTISFTLAKPSKVELKIYNISGQLVKTLYEGWENQGEKSIKWNGTNNFGKKLCSGFYFYRLSSNSFQEVKSMQFLK